MFKKIIVWLAILIASACANIAHSMAIPLPESLNGTVLIVDITDTTVNDPVIHSPKIYGQEKIYFSSTELFYDATAFSGWHFFIDYSVKINSESKSLVISTHLPESRANSGLFTFRQTLLFTSPVAGNTIIEFYNKGKLAFVHKGTFLLRNEELVVNSNGLKDRNFNLNVGTLNEDSNLFPINVGDKIDITFSGRTKNKNLYWWCRIHWNE